MVLAQALLADLDLRPGGIIAWIVIGIVAGWLAGLAMRGGGFGVIGDMVTGLIGSLIGGFLMSMFVQGDTGFWGSMFVAFIGACILIGIVRAVAPGRRV
jgi:uncharacterized membrane protein YeaQ/YmgE (transglycosylase-associated protein family)